MSVRNMDYKVVGREVAFGEVLVTPSDLAPVHDYILNDMVPMLAPARIDFGLSTDCLRMSFSSGPTEVFDSNQRAQHLSVIVKHFSEPQVARTIVAWRTYDMDVPDTNKLVLWGSEMIEGDVVEAKKRVFLVQTSNEFTDLSVRQEETVRKYYERPLFPEDCNNVLGLLGRAVKRYQATHGQ